MGVRSASLVRFVRVLGCALSLLAALFVTGRASADEAREAARASFSQGVDAYARGEYRSALEAFENAYRLAPHPTVRINLGHCQEQLGHMIAARDEFRAYLTEAPGVSDTERQEVEEAIARVETHIGRVTVEVVPADAPLVVDNAAAVLDSAGSIELVEGVHWFRAQGVGSLAVSRSVNVAGGATQRVLLDVTSPNLPPSSLPAPADAAPIAHEDAAPRLETRHRSLRPWAIGFGALAVAAAGGSLAVGLVARSADNDFDRQVKLTRDPALSAAERDVARQDGLDAVDRTHRFARLSDGLLGATAAFAVVSVTLAVVQHRRARSERHSFSAGLATTRGGASMALTGRF